MTPSSLLRPALVGLAALTTTSCGVVGDDARRFESMADAVAGISLDGEQVPVRNAADSGLRPAFVSAEAVANPGDLRVEVMDPHDLWDARDAGLRGAVEQAAPALIEASVPIVAAAVAERVVVRTAAPRTEPVSPRPVAAPAAAPAQAPVLTTLQLGAFSSPDAARAAWTRIAAAGDSVAALSPRFEAVEVDGRTLTRLKVVASQDAARAVCRAADAAQLGCLRRS
ncbi:MAG: SPOR domain-containing protein [Caulobacteraceae bacterium]|nr:SPOR domain-containing protein [Caulobacteraceae bacterium]